MAADSSVPPFHEVTAGTNDFYPAGPQLQHGHRPGAPDTWNLVRDMAERARGQLAGRRLGHRRVLGALALLTAALVVVVAW